MPVNEATSTNVSPAPEPAEASVVGLTDSGAASATGGLLPSEASRSERSNVSCDCAKSAMKSPIPPEDRIAGSMMIASPLSAVPATSAATPSRVGSHGPSRRIHRDPHRLPVNRVVDGIRRGREAGDPVRGQARELPLVAHTICVGIVMPGRLIVGVDHAIAVAVKRRHRSRRMRRDPVRGEALGAWSPSLAAAIDANAGPARKPAGSSGGGGGIVGSPSSSSEAGGGGGGGSPWGLL